MVLIKNNVKNNYLLNIAVPVMLLITGCSGSKNTVSAATSPEAAASGELYNTIAHMDSVLFTAFNTRDIDKLKQLFTGDLEFYHDLGGLTNYSQNMEAFQRTADKKNDLRRDLVPGSLEVYPIKDYGAIQVGSHRFCHTENGKPDCGVFRFVHVWKKTAEGWKIARVVSYGH